MTITPIPTVVNGIKFRSRLEARWSIFFDGLKTQSTKLYELKYNNPKTPVRDAEVNHMIEDIQATCRLIANDKTKYEK